MHLDLGVVGGGVDNPSLEQIEEALKSLPEPEGFAVLSQKDQGYFIQTIFLEPNGGFELEFKEGSDDKMYRCTNAPLSLAVVVRTFQRYAKGDERWKTELEWENLEIPPSPIHWEGVSAVASQKSALLDVAGPIGIFAAPMRSELVTVHTTPEIKRRLEGLAREHDWTVSHAGHVILSLGLAALDAGGVRGQDEG